MSKAPKRELSLFDSTCLIVGIIIGVGIYQTVPDVARGTSNWWGLLAIWIAGGFLSMCGALCYAELATAYPKDGGDYVYLSRAYGPWAGFLFAWAQLAIIRPGNIAVVAFAFATYARVVYDPFAATIFSFGQQIYAGAAVIVLTGINILGVRESKVAQNLLTIVKVLGLLAIVGLAITAPGASGHIEPSPPLRLSVAMLLVLFTFGGWNEMAYVAAEVRNPRRNIVRALVWGTVAVTVLYLLVNGAFLHTLGYSGIAASQAVAADTVSAILPGVGGRIISALICISALGAVNGLVFTGARISYAVGEDHVAFRLLGRWNPRTGTPIRALLLQALIAVGLIVLLGSFVDTILYTAAVVYSFYLATCLSVVVLRRKEPHVDRPYLVTGHPVTTFLFCAVCGFLICSAVAYRPSIAAVSCLLLPLGLPIYWLSKRREDRSLEQRR